MRIGLVCSLLDACSDSLGGILLGGEQVGGGEWVRRMATVHSCRENERYTVGYVLLTHHPAPYFMVASTLNERMITHGSN